MAEPNLKQLQENDFNSEKCKEKLLGKLFVINIFFRRCQRTFAAVRRRPGAAKDAKTDPKPFGQNERFSQEKRLSELHAVHRHGQRNLSYPLYICNLCRDVIPYLVSFLK